MVKHFFVICISVVICSCSENAALKPLDANATVLAFGDSLTYGTGTSREKAYPAVLESLIHRKVINAGVPGEISQQGLSRLPALINSQSIKLLIICHGGNDILHKLDIRQTKQNIQQMINLARQNDIQVVLIAVPEFGLFLDDSPIYQALADENQIPVASNTLGNILGKNTYKSDHIHPNTKGYQLLAESVSLLLVNSGAILMD